MKEFRVAVTLTQEAGMGQRTDVIAVFDTFEEAVSFWREKGGFTEGYGVRLCHPEYY